MLINTNVILRELLIMKYRIYFLEFLTPVHFADNNFGGDLEKASFYCSADTYFSAICSEANLISKEILQSIMEKFEQRKLAISSLFLILNRKNTVDYGSKMIKKILSALVKLKIGYNL